MTRVAVVLLALLVARPSSGQTRAERPVPYRPGETLTYGVSWSMYVTAGTATISVREKKPSYGSTAYYIVAEGRPTPLLSKLYTLYYKVDTLLDAFTLLPQRGSVYSEEGGRKRLKTTVFDQGARKATYEVKTATVVTEHLKLPSYTQDGLGAIFVLRSIPLKAGGTMTMPVSDSGKIYQVKVTVGGREAVETGIGSVAAWKITPVVHDERGRPNGQQLALWISDDARRLPVKLLAGLAVGSFVLVLKDAGGARADPR
jgi:hypothetical protein